MDLTELEDINSGLFDFSAVLSPCSLTFHITDNRANEADFQRLFLSIELQLPVDVSFLIVWFVPISLRPVLGTVAPFVRLWYGLDVVNVFHLVGGFSVCKTAHKIWLRILSRAFEKKLKVLDFA